MKAVFIDRDGTIIIDPPDLRVNSIEELELFQDTIEALKLLSKSGFNIVMISNQAGVGEGLISMDDYLKISNTLNKMLEPSGATILKNYVCPHTPEDNCECRKPKPKMILDAAKEFNINLAESFMIGDRISDIEAGINAGTKTILVETANTPVKTNKADFVAKNLLEAADFVVKNS